MRQDQYERLQALSEKLTEVFLGEADPETWTGANTPLAEMTQQQRGDRYWEKKNAVATLSLIGRVHHLVGVIQANSHEGTGGAEVAAEESLLDREIRDAEKEANARLDELLQAGKKKQFDERVHGGSTRRPG
ncbi:hypothetical protein [Arenimonas sp.]|uniref:hypothetical protein n=1 Tax=Arenimonas sp. TaxID=1872635 RepID=UPI0039E2D359